MREEPTSPHGWTLDTLKEFLFQLIQANDKRYDERFKSSESSVNIALTSAEKAVTKAEASSEKRFESVNEFRSTLADQQRTLMPRAESLALNSQNEKAIEELKKEIAGLRESRSGSEQRGVGVNQGWLLSSGIVAFGVMVAGAIIALFT